MANDKEDEQAAAVLARFYVKHRKTRFFSSTKYPGTSREERTLSYGDLREVIIDALRLANGERDG